MTIFEKGQQNDVPVLIGSNADEGTAFVPAKVTMTVAASDREAALRSARRGIFKNLHSHVR